MIQTLILSTVSVNLHHTLMTALRTAGIIYVAVPAAKLLGTLCTVAVNNLTEYAVTAILKGDCNGKASQGGSV
jgi:ribosomal protein L7Ae-like RNA K-turn-binding protein